MIRYWKRIIRHWPAYAFALILALALMPIAVAQSSDGVVPNDNAGRWAFLVGVFLPLGIAAINRERWSSQIKAVTTFACSLVAALGTAYFAGQIVVADIVSSFLIIFVTATLTFNTIWKPSGIAPAVEKRTG